MDRVTNYLHSSVGWVKCPACSSNGLHDQLSYRIDESNPVEMQGFLAMYANPVVNKSKYENAI